MKLDLSVIVALCTASCALVCFAEDHLVPKHAIESKQSSRNRDSAVADVGLLLKTLLSKLEHGKDSEQLHKEFSGGKDHHYHESEMKDKSHLFSMKEAEMGYSGKRVPLEHGYKESHNPHDDSYGIKKGLTEKDVITLLMKMRELTEAKGSEDMYEKDEYYGIAKEKLLQHKVEAGGSNMKKMTVKMFEDGVYPDKVSDEDVSLAEILYHMKMAGDVATYPEIKMAPLSEMYNKKMADEKIYSKEEHDKIDSDESYMKKVDEFGKTLLKEETYPLIKDDNIEENLKKVAEEKMDVFNDAKVVNDEMAFDMEKTAEDKTLDEWKSDHKELFPVEEDNISEKKFKFEDAHHVKGDLSHSMSDELLMSDESDGMSDELKTSLGVNKEIGTEHDELLILTKELPKEGMEIKDELFKKLKTILTNGKELDAEHDELIHLLKELHKEEKIEEGSIAYEKAKEQARKDAHIRLGDEAIKKHIDGSLSLSSKDFHGTDFNFEKWLSAEKADGIGSKDFHGTELFFEKGMSSGKAHDSDEKLFHGIIGEEGMKAKEMHDLLKSFYIEKEKSMRGSKSAFGDEGKRYIDHDITSPADADKAFKVYEDKFFKKEKTYGTDTYFDGDKDIMETAGDHHIHDVLKRGEGHVLHGSGVDKHNTEKAGETGKGHKMFQDLKAKFFELLTKVLRPKKCHLVTMRPSELLGIVNCISKSKDPILCEKFSVCEKKMPFRVIAALQKCQRECISGEMKKCTRHSPLYPSAEIPFKIFKCVAVNIKELVAAEKKQMIDFEECARIIKAESCGRSKRFRGPHYKDF